MTGTADPGGLTGYGQLVLFVVQLLYWIVLGVAALWATLLFKRYVDFKTGAAEAKADAKAEMPKPVSIEEFTD